ncbi:GPP34 family phosphoprotein [Streptomyces toxytricini]
MGYGSRQAPDDGVADEGPAQGRRCGSRESVQAWGGRGGGTQGTRRVPDSPLPRGRRHGGTRTGERRRAVVVDGAEPDTRTAGLIALIHSAKLHRLAFSDGHRKQVASRMEEVATGQWAAESVRAAIRDMQAAMVAVTVIIVAAAGS